MKNAYEEIENQYFRWLCGIINTEDDIVYNFNRLLGKLFNTDFYYILNMDSNRETDGIDLRYRFGRENGYKDYEISSYLDDHPCSVLEMMVALSIRCENQFAYDPEYGDRTAEWFWKMIKSLGLEDQTDDYYVGAVVENILERFLSRNFKKNGQGGLFTIRNSSKNMRNIDIWYQMCAYLNEVL